MGRVVSSVLVAAGVSLLAAFAVYIFTDRPYRNVQAEPIPVVRYDNPDSYSWSSNLLFKTDADSKNSSVVVRLPPDIEISAAAVYSGMAYITDAGRRKAYCFSLEGAKVWESHKFAVLNGRLPMDVSPEGELWVADAGLRRFERLDLENGEVIGVCVPENGFGSPVEILAPGGGRLLTMDKAGGDIRLFNGTSPAKVLVRNIAPHWQLYKMRLSGGGIAYYDGEKNALISE